MRSENCLKTGIFLIFLIFLLIINHRIEIIYHQIQSESQAIIKENSFIEDNFDGLHEQVKYISEELKAADEVIQLDIDESLNSTFDQQLSDSIALNYACCYRDPNSQLFNVGRPFPMDEKVKKIVGKYMNARSIRSEDKLDYYIPQPVTAFSSNHYPEHLERIDSAIRVFQANEAKGWQKIPIIVYDIGMEPYQVNYVKNHTMLEYRKFQFEKYPIHVENLMTYAWKTAIWAEILPEYPSILWFDTSMNFTMKGRVFYSGFLVFIILQKYRSYKKMFL